MNPAKKLRPAEFVPVYIKNKRRDELRFLPKCCDCGKVIFNIAEANIAVVEGDPRQIGRVTGESTTVREAGRALLFCWDCDKKYNLVPWQSALATFRALDEAQRFPYASTR